jgi:hypothetical protein
MNNFLRVSITMQILVLVVLTLALASVLFTLIPSTGPTPSSHEVVTVNYRLSHPILLQEFWWAESSLIEQETIEFVKVGDGWQTAYLTPNSQIHTSLFYIDLSETSTSGCPINVYRPETGSYQIQPLCHDLDGSEVTYTFEIYSDCSPNIDGNLNCTYVIDDQNKLSYSLTADGSSFSFSYQTLYDFDYKPLIIETLNRLGYDNPESQYPLPGELIPGKPYTIYKHSH